MTERVIYTTVCPICGLLLTREGEASPGRRRSDYGRHVRDIHGDYDVRERSLVGDKMLFIERRGVLSL